jgi:uncharacterized protein
LAEPGLEAAAGIVIAKAPRPGLCKTRLEPLLGPDGCARLQATMVRRAAAWAARFGSHYVAYTPADARGEMAKLCPGATLFEQAEGDLGDRLAHATAYVLADHGGPAVLIGVDAVTLGVEHARAAVEDLASGCDMTIGPAEDGGYYLIGLREPHPELFDLPTEEWGGPTVLRRTLEAAAGAGLGVGMLRAERDLDEPPDAAALLADPLAPEDVVAALRSG